MAAVVLPAILALGLFAFAASAKKKKSPSASPEVVDALQSPGPIPASVESEFEAAKAEILAPGPTDMGKVLDAAAKLADAGATQAATILQAAVATEAKAPTPVVQESAQAAGYTVQTGYPSGTVLSPGVVQPIATAPAPVTKTSGTVTQQTTLANIQERVAAALASGDPEKMRVLAKELTSEGFLLQAAQLYNEAVAREAARILSIPALATQPIPQPVPVPVQVPPPPSPAYDAARKLSFHLNANNIRYGSVRLAKGKEDKTIVRDFQTKAGIKVDGLYGPGSAKASGKYFGDVPIVYYWPTGSQPTTSVPAYRADLLAMADSARANNEIERAKMLELSAAREKGQGYGTSIPVKSTENYRIQAAEATLANPTYQSLSSGTALSGLTMLEQILKAGGMS